MLSDGTEPRGEEAARAVVERAGRDLGVRLRELRLAAGLSLKALAERLGISVSAVSQIERGAMQPSVGRLIALVDALGVPLSAVFDQGGPAPVETAVVRVRESAPVVLEGGVLFRRLAPRPLDAVDFFESTYPPGSTSTAHRQLLRHDGFEMGTVTLGELTIEFEDETVVLGAGDAITFPCERPHRMMNTGASTAVATWLIVHR
ncbi:helix-turn-helix domain-containing protein [Rathayibacter tanaceti]|uniref:HTH-type transcriptional regulator PuuR n=2 Tax=Rathayibacter tanaceti TaxID=1671680 RepID=A0A166IAE4_9MICO|nr:helix-turn-helix domain-containing protein [Rathayibacter tanaceti]KZX22043.1 HTH-type transcriptional regulator PuuR [Rathayibacter tanaceti]QHC54736.1 helix-turn-helix domain-containing protein [Rathayibacter tanaceti]TCO37447.1 cupin domain [Rathayibacter tanaceti]